MTSNSPITWLAAGVLSVSEVTVVLLTWLRHSAFFHVLGYFC